MATQNFSRLPSLTLSPRSGSLEDLKQVFQLVQDQFNRIKGVLEETLGAFDAKVVTLVDGITLTSGVIVDIASISLLTGSQHAWGEVWFTNNGTTVSGVDCWISPTPSVRPSEPATDVSRMNAFGAISASGTVVIGLPQCHIIGPATAYLSAAATFSGGTSLTAYGILITESG